VTTSDVLGTLSDRSVVLSLQELTEDVGHTDPARMPLDSDEAQALVSTLLAADAGAVATPEIAAMSEKQCLTVARRLLAHLVEDPDTAVQTRAVLSDPPADDQMALETAITGAVVLGALITWLQTKVDIKITRKDGKSEFELRVTKNATSTRVLRDLAAIVSRLLQGP
jgi:Effector Associated Constant Component 1